jgi:predicted DNA-binding transcriptional regulator AlpA
VSSQNSASDPDRWVDERELAPILGLSCNTLKNWRARGQGPPFSRLGPKAIRYRLREAMAWAESQGRTAPANTSASTVAGVCA